MKKWKDAGDVIKTISHLDSEKLSRLDRKVYKKPKIDKFKKKRRKK